jgi:hypothetical protein
MGRSTYACVLTFCAPAFLVIVSAWTQGQSQTGMSAGQAMSRPPLQGHQGRYFRWSAPGGWRVSETTNGVTLTAPDGKTKAMYALLLRSQGTVDPQHFVVAMLSRIPGVSNIRAMSSKRLPDQPSGIRGTAWKVIETELSFTDGGVPINGTFICGVNVYYGMYDSTIVGYQAPAQIWPKASLFLPVIARSIIITNFQQLAGNDQLIPVRNNPLDNSALIESWKQKGVSETRISQARREGMMGYERMKDPTTGRIHEMPLEAYDATKGGYHSPDFPKDRDRLLVKPKPGE